ncbi:peptidase M20 [Ktedonobacter sp. SOSP1-52]|uniref:M20/M25/M40 family metallo-hydrolase n=1 Tax=Ktedonobacter sp. SOSP1-52 TaxID=2778366 RepID=UPI00191568C4|nr:M20/M25/M40 family metallo-hydrolase [Ktedonobacter sp. SOSP1-52]GHO70361.1 peptidase M20 [Ktedonobacter sp. SOSP1-52]
MRDIHMIDGTEELAAEAVKHLQALLRCKTVNPPGNESTAIEYIRSQFEAEGIEYRVLEAAPGRVNIWARIRGNGTKRPLLLLSHVDVVPVEREHWSVDPFGGTIQNGYIYGRGAVDTKSLTAKELTLFLHAARQAKAGEMTLSRDLIFLAVADEEQGGTYGMGWIVKNAPELIDVEYALNEGGGFAVEVGGKRIYVCSTAEKGNALIKLRATGDPGHGSVPHQRNAISRLANAVRRVSLAPLPLHVTATARALIATLAQTQKQPQQSLLPLVLNPLLSESLLGTLDTYIADALRAMLHNTASPTLLQAGYASNVIPGEATATLDGRLLPGQTPEMFVAELQRRISDPNVAVEVEGVTFNGHECEQGTELFTAIRDALAMHDPQALISPYLLPAMTDSRFLVPRGIIAYGFDPMMPEPGWPSPQQMAHGHDERISVANVAFGLRVLQRVVTQISA